MEWSPVPHKILFVDRNTSITTSHKSRARKPSIRSPASDEMISDSVELWATDVCFLHIQQMGTSVRLPKIHKTLPEADFESSRSPAKTDSWNKPNLQCWGRVSILLIVCHMLVSIWWLVTLVYSQTIECQVHQFVPSTSISRPFASIILIILQLIQAPPCWIDDHPS